MSAQTAAIQTLIAGFNAHGERAPKAAAGRIVRLGSKAIPDLVEAMQTSRNVRIRRWAAYTLGLFENKRAAAALTKALKDPNMSVRLLAMEALERVNGPKAGKNLLSLLEDESGGVRVRTVIALARLRYKPALNALRRASTRDEKDYVRKAAAHALRCIAPNA